MSRRAFGVSLVLALGITASACAGGPREPNAPTTLTSASSCARLGVLLDLRADLLEGVPAVGVPGYLAQLDAQIASLTLAERRLAGVSAGSSHDASRERDATLAQIRSLTSALEAQRSKTEPLASSLQRTYTALDVAVNDASTCQGVDLRVLEAPPRANRTERAVAALSSGTPEAKAQRKRNEKVAESKACAGANRLVAAMRSLDVSSKLSAAAVGQHLAEMDMDAPTRPTRDALSRALLEHSRALAAFAAATEPKDAALTPQTQIAVLIQDLDQQGRSCIENMTESAPQVVATEKAPRQVTVLVRPKWPERYAGGSTDTGVFGSGVLVRWRTPSGQTAMRVVSNAHVLEGAEEAEIFDAETAAEEGRSARGSETDRQKVHEKAWKARVVRISNDDDLAILQIADAAHAPARGLALRLTPPKDDEAVVAAGFPGLEAKPSFQLSRGTISNATFRTGTGAFGGYVQHTAAIDPGNSGGPLLDGEGRLLGINTIKVTGRESVGFAIPTARVQVALLRADDRRRFLVGHAAAMCRAFVGAMGTDAPHGSLVTHISLSLHDPDARPVGPRIAGYRDAVSPRGEGPIWDARLGAYARLRLRLEDDGGVAPLTGCTDVREIHAEPHASFEGSFRTRSGTHTVRIDDEDGVLRVVELK